jgi:hypothetical protein
MNVNNTLYYVRVALAAAFEPAEATVRTFQIAFIAAQDDDEFIDPQCNWLMTWLHTGSFD